VDLLVFGPHPDDIEIGLGATVAKHVALGHEVGLCDLTQGEMGSNGTVEDRRREADAAAKVLGVAWRENLQWPDGGITSAPEFVRSAVEFIRRHQPKTIAIPYWKDRHPDHVAASEVLTRAVFQSKLRRYETRDNAWRADWLCYYFINDGDTPSFVVDVSDHYQKKRDALACFRTQFAPSGEGAVQTRLTQDSFRQLVFSRDVLFGAQVGVPYAEGIVVREPVVRPSLMKGAAGL
jgi:bacillithiol biosynthesis deacetylase BshB1